MMLALQWKALGWLHGPVLGCRAALSGFSGLGDLK